MHNNLKNTTTEYAGNFIYENGDLKFFNHTEGYVDASDWGNGAPGASEVAKDYVYQFKDHLGNVRLTYQDKNNSGIVSQWSEIVSENNYYPFGLQHKGYNSVVKFNQRRGKV